MALMLKMKNKQISKLQKDNKIPKDLGNHHQMNENGDYVTKLKRKKKTCPKN